MGVHSQLGRGSVFFAVLPLTVGETSIRNWSIVLQKSQATPPGGIGWRVTTARAGLLSFRGTGDKIAGVTGAPDSMQS